MIYSPVQAWDRLSTGLVKGDMIVFYQNREYIFFWSDSRKQWGKEICKMLLKIFIFDGLKTFVNKAH